MSNLPPATSIWTIVFVEGLYYPQRQALVIGDSWTGNAYLGGGSQDRGKTFNVLAVIVNEATNTVFTDWVTEADKTGQYPGMPSLPPGATVQDSVKVTLQ
ncbi:MAG: hypothetical protein ACRDYA_23680 [Egibacteraceae bacterium]